MTTFDPGAFKSGAFKPGKRNLISDVDGILVGHAQNHRIKSGATVITAKQPLLAAVQVTGGAPGTRETDMLASDKLVESVDALVLSGGSALGLDAASGVANLLRAEGRGLDVRGQNVPLVPAAIIFDLHNGGDKNWKKNPYSSLGEKALKAAASEFKLGTVGAGTGALCADLKGGLGSASLEFELPEHMQAALAGASSGKGLSKGKSNAARRRKTATRKTATIGALAVVNPVGSVTAIDSANFWAAEAEIANEFGGLGPASAEAANPYQLPPFKPLARENTTLAVVATDLPLGVAELQRLSVAAHDGFARAIYPSHTPFDGDLVFAVSANSTEGRRAKLHTHTDTASWAYLHLLLGHAAALCVSRAIARGVYNATAYRGDVLPTWQQRWSKSD